MLDRHGGYVDPREAARAVEEKAERAAAMSNAEEAKEKEKEAKRVALASKVCLRLEAFCIAARLFLCTARIEYSRAQLRQFHL